MIFINPPSAVNPELPNLSLAYAATVNNARVVDLNTRPHPSNRFLDSKSQKVYISVRPFNITSSQEIKDKYLQKYPDTKVTSVSGFIDVLCCYPFIDFNDGLKYPISFSDSYPFPNYELFDSFEIFKKNWQSGKWSYSIMTSLGCPYQCVYCQSHNRKWFPRSAKNCYEELKQAKTKYGIKTFSLLDDCFNLDKKRVIDFCRFIKPLKLKWFCTNGLRADRFDEDIAKAMADSGCVHIGFGAECMDDTILKNIRKGVTVNQIKKAVRIAKRYFQGVHCFFIIGLPGSTFEKDINNLRWVVKESITGHFSYWSPFNEANEADPFYGDQAIPKSNAYSIPLQKRIYHMTRYMRAGNYSWIATAVNRIKLIWIFDRTNIFSHISIEVKKKIKLWIHSINF